MNVQHDQHMKNLFFVYGTLKEGFHNHCFLKDKADYIGNFTTMSQHRMVSLGSYPGVLYRGTPGVQIKGEVYQIRNPAVRDSIDQLEGYPSFYDKAQIVTPWGVAIMYVLSKKFRKSHDLSDNEIKSGEWV